VRRLRLALLTLCLAALPATAAAAGPGNYLQVLGAYQANGSVPPCQFTSAQLQDALKGVDAYGEQYFADFTNAVQAALASRASGACAPGGARTQPSGPTAAASHFTPPAVTGSTGSDLPAPILVLGGLTLAAALGAALAVIGRARGWDPRWLAALRHGAGDAGYRAATAWERLMTRGR